MVRPQSTPRRPSKVVQAARAVLLLLALSSISSASTFVLGNDGPGFGYLGVAAGPYAGTLSGTNMTEFFCLNLDRDSTWNTSYQGTVHVPGTQAEDEAAFLSSYLLTHGAPNADQSFIDQYEGPISFAIWKITGSLGNHAADPAAQQWIILAQNAYAVGFTASFLNQFSIFVPDDAGTQSFIGFQPSVPEPSTLLMLAAGLPGLLLGRRWWLRRLHQST